MEISVVAVHILLSLASSSCFCFLALTSVVSLVLMRVAFKVACDLFTLPFAW